MPFVSARPHFHTFVGNVCLGGGPPWFLIDELNNLYSSRLNSVLDDQRMCLFLFLVSSSIWSLQRSAN